MCIIKGITLAFLVGLLVLMVVLKTQTPDPGPKFVLLRRFKVPPEISAGFVGVALEVARPQRQMRDCVRFEVYRSTEEPDVFVVHEVWNSGESKSRVLSNQRVEMKLQLFVEEHALTYDISRYSSKLA